jgi:hypothetical protein
VPAAKGKEAVGYGESHGATFLDNIRESSFQILKFVLNSLIFARQNSSELKNWTAMTLRS